MNETNTVLQSTLKVQPKWTEEKHDLFTHVKQSSITIWLNDFRSSFVFYPDTRKIVSSNQNIYYTLLTYSVLKADWVKKRKEQKKITSVNIDRSLPRVLFFISIPVFRIQWSISQVHWFSFLSQSISFISRKK